MFVSEAPKRPVVSNEDKERLALEVLGGFSLSDALTQMMCGDIVKFVPQDNMSSPYRNIFGADGWECSDLHVNIIDSFIDLLQELVVKIERKWAVENNIEPQYKPDDRVIYCNGVVGTIIEVDDLYGACYIIKREEGADDLLDVVKFEDVNGKS